MARAAEIQPGQAWSDARGEQFEVMTSIENDGKCLVRSLVTQRTSRKGPRALVQQLSAPPSYSMPGAAPPSYAPGPPSYVAGAPTFQRPTGPPPGYGVAPPLEINLYGRPFGAMPEESGAPPTYAPIYSAPSSYSPQQPQQRTPATARGPQPPARNAPRIGFGAGAPVASGFQGPGTFPSELTLFVAQRLAAMRADQAHNPGIVGQEVARALATWKVRR